MSHHQHPAAIDIRHADGTTEHIELRPKRITPDQARELAAWLGNVRSVVERRAYPGSPERARQWVGRWIGQLLEYYAAGATPEEAVSATPTTIKFSNPNRSNSA